MPRVTEVSRMIAKSAMIYPVAFSMHAYALLALPFSVSAALFRSLTGVSGKGIDELFASQFAPGGAGESDTALLRGLREKHKLAMAALHDQLDDSDSRYKTVYEKLRDSERMRNKMQHRLTAAQEELILSGNGVPESPRGSLGASPGGWSGAKGKDDHEHDAAEADKIPVYFTTFLCVAALLYFYDVPDVPAFDRKLAMMAPGMWMTVLGMKHAALNKVLILGNLVFFGYLLHILVEHRRGGGLTPSSALGGIP